jgi:ubiquinone/menaquinone biosynthesis C-methylase UbiE
MASNRFEAAYQGSPPWDVPEPQPALVGLEDEGKIVGSVLDCGCGTGENALFFASRGHDVLGLDFVPVAIERAREKAEDRGISARFEVGDALRLDSLGLTFDTVTDCGLFHTFDEPDRPRYVAGLERVVRPGGRVVILCFSEREPPGAGPKRITQAEIRDAFAGPSWHVAEIRETRFRSTGREGEFHYSPGGPIAWLSIIDRVEP